MSATAYAPTPTHRIWPCPIKTIVSTLVYLHLQFFDSVPRPATPFQSLSPADFSQSPISKPSSSSRSAYFVFTREKKSIRWYEQPFDSERYPPSIPRTEKNQRRRILLSPQTPGLYRATRIGSITTRFRSLEEPKYYLCATQLDLPLKIPDVVVEGPFSRRFGWPGCWKGG